MTITINQIQYTKSEVLRMVMKRAHELKRIMYKSTFSSNLKTAWAEIKRQIMNMEHRRISNMSKEEYAALPTQRKLDWVNGKIFYHSMKDMWDRSDWAYENKLQAEKAKLVAELAA